MSNPLDLGFSASTDGTAGFPSTLAENFHAAFDVASHVDNTIGLENDVQSRWEDSVRKWEALTGTKSGVDTSTQTVHGLLHPLIDPNNTRIGANVIEQPYAAGQDVLGAALVGVDPAKQAADNVAKAQQFNAQIKAGNYPGVSSIEDILKQVVQQRGILNQNLAQTTEDRPGLMGSLARFAGGAAGAFTDPLQVASLAFGGGEGGVIRRIATNLAIGAGTQGAIQAVSVQPTQQALGEPTQSPLEAAAEAGVGQAVLGEVFHGLGALTSRVLGKLKAPDVAPEFDAGSEANLRQLFTAHEVNPDARAGLSLLDENKVFRESNPYGDTDVGMRQFSGEIDDIYNLISGKTDTAVARALPPPEVPTLDNLDFHTETVREQQPQVYDRLLTATAAVNDLDTKIADVTQRIDGLSITDAITHADQQAGAAIAEWQAKAADESLSPRQQAFAQRKVDELTSAAEASRTDPAVAARIAELEKTLGGPVVQQGKPMRAMVKELDALVKQVGDKSLGSAMDSLEAPLRDNLAALRNERVAAAREFRRARSVMDREIERVKLQQQAKEWLANAKPKPAARDVAAAQRAVEDAHAIAPDAEEATVASMDTPDGIDLGNGLVLDRSFKISDPTTGAETTVGAIAAQLKDDAALVEAMRSCAL